MNLRSLIEKSRKIAIIPVISLIISALFLTLYGAYLTGETIFKVFTDPSSQDTTLLSTKFIALMDFYLLAVILYIFAIGLYELFIGKLDLPEWLAVESIDQLKAKLASVIILILAVTFTKKIVLWETPLESLFFALAISAVMLALIFYYKVKEPHQ